MRTERDILTAKLNGIVQQRADDEISTLIKIITLSNRIDDYIASASSLAFGRKYELEGTEAHKGEVAMRISGATPYSLIHDNAIMQIGERLDIPSGYLRRLARGEDWERDLSTKIMNEHNEHKRGSRYLLRLLDGKVMGFLSDKYRIIDSSQVFVSFLEAAAQNNFRVVDSHYGDVVQHIKVIRPEIVEIETEGNGVLYAVFGARLGNSDFGAGALELQLFMLNVRCMNGLVGESVMRKVHVGAKLPEGIDISDDTVKKETAARVAVMKDAVATVFSEHYLQKAANKIRRASSVAIDLEQEVKLLPKRGILQSEADKTLKALLRNSKDDGVEGDPTILKLVMALTAVAREESKDRQIEIEAIAGNMLGL